MSKQTIHLVFKTHLDIGFSDLAGAVRAQYREHFIPQALVTAEHFFQEDRRQPKFIWTTGAWLIADYLATASAEECGRLERAIDNGLIRWHALPFTTHSELMSPDLFRAGLSYARGLDRRFGRTTTAAKMTDVPGHTRGIVPLLAEAGVRFLHLGVNEACPVPDVPAVFRWRSGDGAEVVVMYQDSYGGTYFPEGHAAGLSFAHTNDNAGPQSISQTVEVHRQLQALHPDAEIVASTLDAYGEVLWQRREELPVVELEVGDSWIHGIGTDPTKVSRFLALQRLYDTFAAEALTPSREAFGRTLALVPEHTWGVDIKTFLRDERAWDRPAFEAARAGDSRFAYAEESWAEQRRYLDEAVAELTPEDQARATSAWTAEVPPPVDSAKCPDGSLMEVGGWTVSVEPTTGDLLEVTAPDGVGLGPAGGSLMGYRYESYDDADVQRHLDSYLTHRPDWAILDHGRPGLALATTARSACFAPRLEAVRRTEHGLSIAGEMPVDAVSELGAPRCVELFIEPEGTDSMRLSLVLREKPANRMPEASFFHFTPARARAWRYLKMGAWHDPRRVARRGGGQLQAVSAVAAETDAARVEVAPLDSPLAGPADWPFMVYDPEPPDLAGGLRFNLHNTKWGTNFPMWWSGNFVSRFVLKLGPRT